MTSITDTLSKAPLRCLLHSANHWIYKGQSKAITPATSTPSARIDIILLVKSIATTRNKSTPAAAQRSLPITGTGPEEVAEPGQFSSAVSLLLPRYRHYLLHQDTGKEHRQRHPTRQRQPQGQKSVLSPLAHLPYCATFQMQKNRFDSGFKLCGKATTLNRL